MGIKRARWILLVGALGCTALGETLPPGANAAPCPEDTRLRVSRSNDVRMAWCETRDRRVEGWRGSWWPGGQRAMFGHYHDGFPDGVVTTWHRNGARRLQARWRAGRREGRSAEWYESGQLSSTVVFRQGVRHGSQLDYYPTGQPMSLASFRDGMQHGPVVAWYTDGTTQVEGLYDRGRADGRWGYWDASGALDTVIEWQDGVEVPARDRALRPSTGG